MVPMWICSQLEHHVFSPLRFHRGALPPWTACTSKHELGCSSQAPSSSTQAPMPRRAGSPPSCGHFSSAWNWKPTQPPTPWHQLWHSSVLVFSLPSPRAIWSKLRHEVAAFTSEPPLCTTGGAGPGDAADGPGAGDAPDGPLSCSRSSMLTGCGEGLPTSATTLSSSIWEDRLATPRPGRGAARSAAASSADAASPKQAAFKANALCGPAAGAACRRPSTSVPGSASSAWSS
mmetsp:Transcript_17355/g.49108  ORF Transcript_17355/g.49108 Transcript_17355/m.49108 type:complete len:232 (-) Transcript_17355:146-841(-)